MSTHRSGESVVTEGIIELVKCYYDQLSSDLQPTNVPRLVDYALCSPCVHISQRNEGPNFWSCGYKNIQMLCYSMLENRFIDYKSKLFSGEDTVPDTHGIQWWIEKAWDCGFDHLGTQI